MIYWIVIVTRLEQLDVIATLSLKNIHSVTLTTQSTKQTHPTLVTSLPFAIAFKQNILHHFELIENSGIPNTLNTISNYTSQTGSGPSLRLCLLQRANVGWGHQYTRNCNGLTTCAAYPYSRCTIAVMVMAKWFPVQAECAAAATEGGPTRLGDWRGRGIGGPSCLRRSNLLVDGYQYRWRQLVRSGRSLSLALFFSPLSIFLSLAFSSPPFLHLCYVSSWRCMYAARRGVAW